MSGYHGDGDAWVVKLNSSGNILWQKCLGGTNSDGAYSIQQTGDGGFIVAGETDSNDGDVSGKHGDADYWVVKLNSSGDIEWQKCLGGTFRDVAQSIQQIGDWGFIVAGSTESNNGDVSGNHGSYDSWVVKLNLPEPQLPPMLFLSNIHFADKNGNNRIDANEDCTISFTISNKGKGPARNIKVKVENNSAIQGLSFSNISTVGNINPNATQTVNIPIGGTMNLTSGTANIKVSFTEQMGFQPDPFELNIETKEFIKPNVQVVDHSFLTDNGIIQLGLPVQLKVLVQNIGQGTAEDVKISFQYPSNVFPNGPKDFEIGTLPPGAAKELIFEFMANKLYTEKNIPITAKINEKYDRFGVNKQMFAIIGAK